MYNAGFRQRPVRLPDPVRSCAQNRVHPWRNRFRARECTAQIPDCSIFRRFWVNWPGPGAITLAYRTPTGACSGCIDDRFKFDLRRFLRGSCTRPLPALAKRTGRMLSRPLRAKNQHGSCDYPRRCPQIGVGCNIRGFADRQNLIRFGSKIAGFGCTYSRNGSIILNRSSCVRIPANGEQCLSRMASSVTAINSAANCFQCNVRICPHSRM